MNSTRTIHRWPRAAALILASIGVWVALAEEKPTDPTESFDTGLAACKDLPTNRRLELPYPPKEVLPIKTFKPLGILLDFFTERSLTGPLAKKDHWLGQFPDRATFFHPTKLPSFETPFQPFAQRLQLPPGSEVILHGDLHGDIKSFLYSLKALEDRGYLKDFKIIKPNAHMLFLGDYTDRGMYGVEVIYTLMRLKLMNPDNVWLVRGNHEDIQMVAKYGFLHEGKYKYGTDFDQRKVTRIYSLMPVVLYLGCENTYVQCNHGGIEPGYSVKKLLGSPAEKHYELISKLNRADYLKAHPELIDKVDSFSARMLRVVYQNYVPKSPTSPNPLGFLWTDYTLQPHEPALRWDDNRPGWTWGQLGTRQFLDYVSAGVNGPRVQAIFRAHQHNRGRDPMMSRLIASKGVFEHWQKADLETLTDANVPELEAALSTDAKRSLTAGAVYTLNVSPDSIYGLTADYDFDTCAILTLQPQLEDWTMETLNATVPVPKAEPPNQGAQDQ